MINAYDEAIIATNDLGVDPFEAELVAREYAAYAARCEARPLPAQVIAPVAIVDFSARCERDEHDFARVGNSFAVRALRSGPLMANEPMLATGEPISETYCSRYNRPHDFVPVSNGTRSCRNCGIGEAHANEVIKATYAIICDVCDNDTTSEYVDGKTKFGMWATMCPACYGSNGIGLGTGKGPALL